MKKLMNKIRKANKGFTLVELIIVVAIIAVLTVVLAPQYVKYIEKSKVAADDNTAATMLQEVEVAIVDASASGDDITTGGTITISDSGTVAGGGLDSDITASMTEADGGWQNAKLQQAGETYVITVSVDATSGAVTANGAKSW